MFRCRTVSVKHGNSVHGILLVSVDIMSVPAEI